MMLRPKQLPSSLRKVCTGGIEFAMLLRSDGMLLASSEDRLSKPSVLDDKLIGAVCAGMWLNLADDSSNQPVKKSESNSAEARRKDLHCMIVNFENGRLCVVQVGQLLVCLKSNLSVEIGAMKKKAETLAEYYKVVMAGLLQSGYHKSTTQNDERNIKADETVA